MTLKLCSALNIHNAYLLPQKRISGILDRLHRGAVNVLLGTTVFFACFLSYQIYDLICNVAPRILSEQKKYEDEFLREISDENGESGSLVQTN
ncbi:hypothetical protein T4B_9104 [Trichinella pseudospiralis]|uniref:Uncharacterized protein n=1 Tax=Trichinella pseudospiralis TaxID=6337 RepID=A0A0V1J665_TRIPS|nr:hypothetical protein T4B_9104 [Trichinella pseudospiralis]KRZ42741.1 hypothetical protein T4C_5509 [Trichinella pseudospiralis]